MMNSAGYQDSSSIAEDINQLVTEGRAGDSRSKERMGRGSYSRDGERMRDHYREHRDPSNHQDRRRDKDRHRERIEPDRHREHREREPERDRYKERERHREPRGEKDRGERGDRSERDRGVNEGKSRHRSRRGGYRIDFNNRPTLWDIPPPGYENMPPSEFKVLKASGALPVLAMPQGSSIILRARRLYVGDVTSDLDEEDFLDFINSKMEERKIAIKPGNPAISVELNDDGTSAYLELRTAEEATEAIVLDGVVYKGRELKIRRPKDYQPSGGYYYGVPHISQDTLNKLFVACIPVYLNDDQVKELLSAFGELKAFNLVKDGASGLSKGYAFCEYRDPSVTDLAIAGLNGMQIADKKLVVQRAVLGSRHGSTIGGIIPAQMQVPGLDPNKVMGGNNPTEVLCLMNMITVDDLLEEQDYEDIVDDIRSECSKYGEVVSVEIPRPHPEYFVSSVGKIFVEFVSPEMCKLAHDGLAGRKFAGRMVITSYFDLDKYRKREF